MSKQNTKRIHLIYSLIVSVLVITLGAALIASALHIYRADPTGDPYNPDSISTHFQNIAILVYVTLGAIVGGVLLHLAFPSERAKARPIRDEWVLMQKAARKAGNLTPELTQKIAQQRRLRILMMVLSVFGFAVLMVVCGLYLVLKATFTVEHATQDIMKASIVVLSPAVLGLAIMHLCGSKIRKSVLWQTEIYKAAAGGTVPVIKAAKDSRGIIMAVRCVIATAAVALIVLGIFNESAKDVLAKAVKICTECIGLG